MHKQTWFKKWKVLLDWIFCSTEVDYECSFMLTEVMLTLFKSDFWFMSFQGWQGFREHRTALIAVYLMSFSSSSRCWSWLSSVLDHSQPQLHQHFCAESPALLLRDCICGRKPDSDWHCIDHGGDGRWQRKIKGMLLTAFQERNTLCWWKNGP